MIKKELNEKINSLISRFNEIPETRTELLKEFANYLSNKLIINEEINLIFICTHNSRRSHISQILAQTAAEFFSIPNINCYSGGTEVTAFNIKAISALKNIGFKIEMNEKIENPFFHVYYSEDKKPLLCFSKLYNDNFNPQNNFVAIMTCSDADENCPIILGAEKRYPIKYEDPKIFDNTELESVKYSERIEQIGIEMLFVFSNVIRNS